MEGERSYVLLPSSVDRAQTVVNSEGFFSGVLQDADMPGVLDRLFGTKKRPLRRIVVDPGVLDDVLGAAETSHPREFSALLEGTIDGDTLRITSYVLPHSTKGQTSVVMKLGLLPSTMQTLGSIHSHPGASAVPSEADIRFFGKSGLVHFIMARPYSRSTVKGYDRWGREIEFHVE